MRLLQRAVGSGCRLGRFLRQFRMRLLAVLLVAATVGAQSTPRVQISNTTESLRCVSAVSHEIACASGTHGTYLRTTARGRTWLPAQVPDAATLDFRPAVALYT